MPWYFVTAVRTTYYPAFAANEEDAYEQYMNQQLEEVDCVTSQIDVEPATEDEIREAYAAAGIPVPVERRP